MSKKHIDIKLMGKLEAYYNKCKEAGEETRSILPKLNKMLKESGHEGYAVEKSLYNLVNKFNNSSTTNILTKAVVKNIDKEALSMLKDADAFDLNLSWQNAMLKDMSNKMYARFVLLEAKGDKANIRDLHETVKITKDLIDSAVKIDALNARKIDINNPSGNTTVGIVLHMDGQNSKRLEEVTANIIEGNTSVGPNNNNLILEEASYG